MQYWKGLFLCFQRFAGMERVSLDWWVHRANFMLREKCNPNFSSSIPIQKSPPTPPAKFKLSNWPNIHKNCTQNQIDDYRLIKSDKNLKYDCRPNWFDGILSVFITWINDIIFQYGKCMNCMFFFWNNIFWFNYNSWYIWMQFSNPMFQLR